MNKLLIIILIIFTIWVGVSIRDNNVAQTRYYDKMTYKENKIVTAWEMEEVKEGEK